MKEIIISARTLVGSLLEKIITQKPAHISGFTSTWSPLYGGHHEIDQPIIDDSIIQFMDGDGIKLSLELTNYLFTEEAYTASLPLLDKYHKLGNSVIITTKTLAERIAIDFPNYTRIASDERNIRTIDDITLNLNTFDEIILPSILISQNRDFLTSIPKELKTVLIMNGDSDCSYICDERVCKPAQSMNYIDYRIVPMNHPSYNSNSIIMKACTNRKQAQYYHFNYETAALFEDFNKIKLNSADIGDFALLIDVDSGTVSPKV